MKLIKIVETKLKTYYNILYKWLSHDGDYKKDP